MLRRASCGRVRTELEEGRLIWQQWKRKSVDALWTVLSELKPDSAPLQRGTPPPDGSTSRYAVVI
jgi:hypothetical protein